MSYSLKGQHVLVSSALDKLDGGSPLKFTDPLLSASSVSFFCVFFCLFFFFVFTYSLVNMNTLYIN